MYDIIGPPGCGKSTQVKLLEELGFVGVSAGELLRRNAPQSILEPTLQGELADHDYINQLIGQALDGLKQIPGHNRVILDGYPRAVVQARWLIEDYGAKILGCLILNADSEQLAARLLQRDRTDDTRDSIQRRFKIFDDNVDQITSYYQDRSVPIFEIDALDTIENIHFKIRKILGSLD